METILSVNKVNKRIKKKRILEEVSFTLSKGDILGIIGENGCGKTTLFRVITGVNKIDSGEINYLDSTSGCCDIGSLIEKPTVFPNMSGLNNMKYFGKIAGVNDENSLLEILDLMGLSKAAGKKVRTYSLGMKQRLGIAVSLIGDIKILILDEPFNGLDKEGVNELEGYILKLRNEKNISVIISSHTTEELEKICNRFIIMRSGKIVCAIMEEELKPYHNNIEEIDKFIIKKMEEI